MPLPERKTLSLPEPRPAGWKPEEGRYLRRTTREESCRLLCPLGHLLVALGRRLERYGASPVESGVARQMNDAVR